METQTRFDLNAATAKWQQELAAQPDLTPEVCRELETHLRDTIAELQGRGLNNEESFWLARRRTGQPQQLGEEFAKADPAKVWRERVFWLVLMVLIYYQWICSYTYLMIRHLTPWSQHTLFSRLVFLLPQCLPLLFSLAAVVFVARGWVKLFVVLDRIVLQSRLRFAAAFLLWALINAYLLFGSIQGFIAVVEMIVWPSVLIGLLLLLMPKKTALKVRHA